jgi:hypothetical protein
MTGRNVATQRFFSLGPIADYRLTCEQRKFGERLSVGDGNVFGEFSNWHIADVYCWVLY